MDARDGEREVVVCIDALRARSPAPRGAKDESGKTAAPAHAAGERQSPRVWRTERRTQGGGEDVNAGEALAGDVDVDVNLNIDFDTVLNARGVAPPASLGPPRAPSPALSHPRSLLYFLFESAFSVEDVNGTHRECGDVSRPHVLWLSCRLSRLTVCSPPSPGVCLQRANSETRCPWE